MRRVVILGGGVGGTLAANLLARRLRRRIEGGQVQLALVDRDRDAHLPTLLHVPRHGPRAPRDIARPERDLLDRVSTSSSAMPSGRRRCRASCDSPTVDRCPTTARPGDRRAPGARGDRPSRRGSAPLLQRCCGATAARGAGRVPRRADRDRHRRDALQMPAGAAGGRLPHRGGAPGRGLRDVSDIHFCSPIGRAFTIESVSEMATPILAEKGIELHTFFNVEAIDPDRREVASLEGEVLPYDLLFVVPPHRGAQSPGLGSRPRPGRLAADRPAHAPGRRAPRHLRPWRRDGPATLQGGLHGALRGPRRRGGRGAASKAAKSTTSGLG